PDGAGRDRRAVLEGEQVADALHRRVAIGLGIFRKELVWDERPVRPPPADVGEGAAAVDPEVPGVGHRRAGRVVRHRPTMPRTGGSRNWWGPGGYSHRAPFMHQPACKPGFVGRDAEAPRVTAIPLRRRLPGA